MNRAEQIVDAVDWIESSTEPTETDDGGPLYPGVKWLDTSGPYVLKRRNSSNDGWDTIGAGGSGGVDHATLTETSGQSIPDGGGYLTWDTIVGAPTPRQGFDTLAGHIAGGAVTWLTVDRAGWLHVHPHADFAATITGGTAKVVRASDQQDPHSWPSGTGVWVDEQQWLAVQDGDRVAIFIDQSEGTSVAVDAGTLGLWLIADSDVDATADADPTMGTATEILSAGHKAFPGLVLGLDGTLVGLYRDGSGHTSTDGDIVMITSTDGGTTWSSPTTVLDDGSWDYRGAVLTRLDDGTLVAAVERRNSDGTDSTSGATFVKSTDNGATWGSEVVVTHGLTHHARGMQIVELDNADLLFFVYGRNTGDASSERSVVVSKSTDGGDTWATLATVADGPTDTQDYSEVGAALMDDGTVVVLIREDALNALWLTTSDDSGATWSAPTSVLSNASGRPTLERRADDDLFAIVRDQDAGSERAELIRSEDAGTSWTLVHTFTETASSDMMTYGQMLAPPSGLLVLFAYEQGSSDSDLWFAAQEDA